MGSLALTGAGGPHAASRYRFAFRPGRLATCCLAGLSVAFLTCIKSRVQVGVFVGRQVQLDHMPRPSQARAKG